MTIHMKRIAECDQCHKRVEVPDDVSLFEGWGWYEVRFEPEKEEDWASWDFCSVHCLAKWAEERVKAPG